MKTKKCFDMDTLATLATTATHNPLDAVDNSVDEKNVCLVETHSADDQYVAVAIACLRRLQKKYGQNLEAGGYDPAGASVPIANWIIECARSGLSATRLLSIKDLLLSSVIFEEPYLLELPEGYKSEPLERKPPPLQPDPADERIRRILESVISDMPVSLEEVLSSRLFNNADLEQIQTCDLSPQGLRLYIGSWLVAHKKIPFVLNHDWQDRLQTKNVD